MPAAYVTDAALLSDGRRSPGRPGPFHPQRLYAALEDLTDRSRG